MENGKTYRIKANPGSEKDIHLGIDLAQKYKTFEILSVKLDSDRDFKLHSSNYGIVVGRVIANGGFGVPNAKVSIFIKADDNDLVDKVISELYPFTSYNDLDKDGLRYNILPSYEVDKCHQAVGSLPSKEYMLDNDVILEVFDKYYKFTTRTNNSGDYMISGIPVGTCDVHMDLDLSDCGVLSQRPRDFLYKGYSIEEFESPNQFKKSKDLDYLSQIISQNSTIEVLPFWGNDETSPQIGITRCDINVTYKFEPTCVFMGSLIGDGRSAGISRQCVPTDSMGNMDELVSGSGTIEMVRKTLTGAVEEFQVKGTELINGDGVWCYQIPMNLDYMTTDEYGNLIPTDNPEKGIPTRTRVRFRISMEDSLENQDFYYRGKILVPNNPQNKNEVDYNFGTYTKEESFRDLYWDDVYTVKSYFPRFQRMDGVKKDRFTGIKHCNISGNNNPMPYNNLRIKLPFMFSLMCILVKSYVSFLKVYNGLVYGIAKIMTAFTRASKVEVKLNNMGLRYGVLKGGFCPELDNWYFAPRRKGGSHNVKGVDLITETFKDVTDFDFNDPKSNDTNNESGEEEYECITTETDFLMSCLEMNLAQEYKVINFDFYNDWINGVIYFPRWMRKVVKKRKIFFGLIPIEEKVRGCIDDKRTFAYTRRYVQQCALSYKGTRMGNKGYIFSEVSTLKGCAKRPNKQICHKKQGSKAVKIFRNNGGIVHEQSVLGGMYAYYMKPCEFMDNGKKINLFATDIVLLGNLKEENIYGLPQAFRHLSTTSYQMPTNLALTNVEENGFIYTNGNKKCFNAKGGEYSSRDITNVSRKGGELGFDDIKQAYGQSSDAPVYDISDESIPRTEAAGISWDFEGYGQGKNNFNNLYYPGGHFLGMSCTSPSTNIKTCVNLSRICELGVEMSSRHENIGGAINVDEKPKPFQYYLIPTGVIGKDEVYDDDFRNMFATLNFNRRLDKEVGGRAERKFDFINSNGFIGELSGYINNKENEYNCSVEIKDDLRNEKTYGNAASYDEHEWKRTFRRTIENLNLGYYMFRLGIDDLSKSRMKYLVEEENGVSVPQYENSFYFYFGLKDGATALDILNRDFFSVCKDKGKTEPKAQVEIAVDDTSNLCNLTGNISINTVNMSTPITVDILEINTDILMTKTYKTEKFVISDLPFGKYNITITDVKKISIESQIIIGFGEKKFNIQEENFGFRKVYSNEYGENYIYNDNDNGIREPIGGYVSIGVGSNFFNEKIIDDNPNTFFSDSIKERDYSFIILENNEKKYIYTATDNSNIDFDKAKYFTKFDDFKFSLSEDKKNIKKNIHLWNINGKYEVYFGVKCADKFNYILLDNFNLSTDGYFDLYFGNKGLSYRETLKFLKPGWWKKIINEDDSIKNLSDYFNDNFKETGNLSKNELCWLLRHAVVNRSSSKEFKSFKYIFSGSVDNNSKKIFIGNPEKEIIKDNEESYAPKINFDEERGECGFPTFLDSDNDKFDGYFLDNRLVYTSTGSLTVYKDDEEYRSQNRPCYGIFGYNEFGNSFDNILTNEFEPIGPESEHLLKAKIYNLENGILNNLINDQETVLGQRASVQIGYSDNYFVYPVIKRIEETFNDGGILKGFDITLDFSEYASEIEKLGVSFSLNKKINTPMSLFAMFYFPNIKMPMSINGNIIRESSIKYDTTKLSQIFDVKRNFNNEIKLEGKNNNLINGDNIEGGLKINGRTINRNYYDKALSKINYEMYEEGNSIIEIYEENKYDTITKYRHSTDENYINIEFSEEITKNIKDNISEFNGEELELETRKYDSNASFYNDIIINNSQNKTYFIGNHSESEFFYTDINYDNDSLFSIQASINKGLITRRPIMYKWKSENKIIEGEGMDINQNFDFQQIYGFQNASQFSKHPGDFYSGYNFIFRGTLSNRPSQTGLYLLSCNITKGEPNATNISMYIDNLLLYMIEDYNGEENILFINDIVTDLEYDKNVRKYYVNVPIIFNENSSKVYDVFNLFIVILDRLKKEKRFLETSYYFNYDFDSQFIDSIRKDIRNRIVDGTNNGKIIKLDENILPEINLSTKEVKEKLFFGLSNPSMNAGVNINMFSFYNLCNIFPEVKYSVIIHNISSDVDVKLHIKRKNFADLFVEIGHDEKKKILENDNPENITIESKGSQVKKSNETTYYNLKSTWKMISIGSIMIPKEEQLNLSSSLLEKNIYRISAKADGKPVYTFKYWKGRDIGSNQDAIKIKFESTSIENYPDYSYSDYITYTATAYWKSYDDYGNERDFTSTNCKTTFTEVDPNNWNTILKSDFPEPDFGIWSFDSLEELEREQIKENFTVPDGAEINVIIVNNIE